MKLYQKVTHRTDKSTAIFEQNRLASTIIDNATERHRVLCGWKVDTSTSIN